MNIRLILQIAMVVGGYCLVAGGAILALQHYNAPIEHQTIKVPRVIDPVIGNDTYIFSFIYTTRDVLAANNPIDVEVNATLQNVKTNSTLLRFEGASDYIDSNSAFSNEVNLTKIYPSEYYFRGAGKLIYGAGGKHSAWLLGNRPNQTYGDKIEDVIEVESAASFLLLEANKELKKSSDAVLGLTFSLIGIGIIQIGYYSPKLIGRKKPKHIKIDS